MEEERDAVVTEVREKIKRFNISVTELKGLVKSRVTQKQIEDYLKRKQGTKQTAKKSK